MESQFQPNNQRESPPDTIGFSRWSFKFNLTRPAHFPDTIGFSRWSFSFYLTRPAHCPDTIGFSRWSLSFNHQRQSRLKQTGCWGRVAAVFLRWNRGRVFHGSDQEIPKVGPGLVQATMVLKLGILACEPQH